MGLIRERVQWCEREGVEMLCCPEGVLGGLADYADRPADLAIDVEGGELAGVLGPLASDRVTTIVGFTERDSSNRLYNAAAIFHRGSVAGVYRKLYPAIHSSVYSAGGKIPVFTIGDLTFGIVICLDSTYLEPARVMAAQGAAALFVPTNTGMPPSKGGAGLVAEARNADIARAVENGISVVRSDVVGRCGNLTACGASGIVGRGGSVLATAPVGEAGLIVADIKTTRRDPRPGWDAAKNPAVADAYRRLVTGGAPEAQPSPRLQSAAPKIEIEGPR